MQIELGMHKYAANSKQKHIVRAISLLKGPKAVYWRDPGDIASYMAPVGPELVTNGDFSSAAGWTVPTGWTITGGKASQNGSVGTNFLEREVTMRAGASYRISVNVDSIVPGSGNFSIRLMVGGSSTVIERYTTPGQKTLVYVPPSEATQVRLVMNAADGSVSIDNISVRELTGLSACTMFQDSAGTTPVTAVEQPVGLMLDKSRTPGPELVTNGNSESAVATIAGEFLANLTKSRSTDFAQTGTASAKLTSSAGTVSHYWYLYVVPAGRAIQLTGWAYIPSGATGGQALRAIDIEDGSWIVDVVPGTSTNAWVPFTVIRQAKATAWQLTLGNNVAASWGTASIYIDNISVREIPGAHFIQTTPASRPTLSSRYNLLTKTEQFDDAAWTPENAGVTPNATAAPDGTTTADRFTPTTTSGRHSIAQAFVASMLTTRHSISVKADGYSKVAFKETNGTGFYAAFDLSAGTVLSTSGTDATIAAEPNGFWRIGFTNVGGALAGHQFRFIVLPTSYTTGDPNSFPFAADGTSGVFIHGASMTVTPDASLPYQRVNTATDYDFDFSKFPPYLRYDGVDDSQASAATVDLNGVVSDGQTRRNLLSASEAFDDAVWGVATTGGGVAPVHVVNDAVAPDGTLTADRITFSAPVSGDQSTLAQSASGLTVSANYTASIHIKAATVDDVGKTILYRTVAGSAYITHVLTADYQRIARTSAAVAATADGLAFGLRPALGGSSGTVSVHVWGAQLEAGSTATTYQKTGTDKITVVGAWHKVNSTSRMALEFSANSDSNNGSFSFATGAWGDSRDYFSTRGTVLSYPPFSTTAPTSYVVSASSAIADDNITIRRNGVQVVNSSADLGTGNFGNYTMHVGSRAGSSLRFNGREYGHALFNTTLTASELAAVEAYFRSKSRAY